jgi:hypothetical protein
MKEKPNSVSVDNKTLKNVEENEILNKQDVDFSSLEWSWNETMIVSGKDGIYRRDHV